MTIIIIIWLLILFLVAVRDPWAGFGLFVYTVVFPILLFLKYGG